MKTSTLDNYWSKAVRYIYHGRCAICMNPAVDAHHVVHRGRNWALRWDVKNGIALCRECHALAETLYYVNMILKIVDAQYLVETERKYRFKSDILTDLNMSEEEYKKNKSMELKKIYENRI